MKQKVLAIILMATMALSLAACGSSAPAPAETSAAAEETPAEETSSSTEEAAAEEPAEEPAEEAPAEETAEETPAEETAEETDSSDGPKTIGLVVADLTNVFCVYIVDAVRAVVEANGDELMLLGAGSFDPEECNNALSQFIAADVDGIVLHSPTSDGPIEMLKEIKAAGIPVVSVDININVTEEDGLLFSQVGSDGYKSGYLAGEDLVRRAEENNQQINCCSIRYDAMALMKDRIDGFTDAVADCELINVLEYTTCVPQTREQEMLVAEGWAQKYPDLNCINGQGDPFSLAFIRGVEAQGMNVNTEDGFYVYSTDGTEDGWIAVHTGKMTASVYTQPAVMGKAAIEDLYVAMNGGTLDHEWNIKTDVIYVDKTNVDQYLKEVYGYTDEQLAELDA